MNELIEENLYVTLDKLPTRLVQLYYVCLLYTSDAADE